MKGQEIYDKLHAAQELYEKMNSIEYTYIKKSKERLSAIDDIIANPVVEDGFTKGKFYAEAEKKEDARYKAEREAEARRKSKGNRFLSIPVFLILLVLQIVFLVRCHYVFAVLGIIASVAVFLLGFFGLLNKRPKNPMLLICRILCIFWIIIPIFFALISLAFTKVAPIQQIIMESFKSFEFNVSSMNLVYAGLVCAVSAFIMLLILNTRRKAANTDIVFKTDHDLLREALLNDEKAEKDHDALIKKTIADNKKFYAPEIKELNEKIKNAEVEIEELRKQAIAEFPLTDDMCNLNSCHKVLNACVEYRKRYREYPPTTYELWDMYYTIENEKEAARQKAMKDLSDTIYNSFKEVREREERERTQREITNVRRELEESNRLQREYNEQLEKLNRSR